MKRNFWLSLFLLPFMMGLSCPTIDEPLPAMLSAPLNITGSVICKYDENELRMHEMLSINWERSTTDTISISSFSIISIQKDTYKETIFKNDIPHDIFSYSHNLHDLNIDRKKEQELFFRIFAIDSLGRNSDTSMICTVAIARLPQPQHPFSLIDTLNKQFYFKWNIIGTIFEQTISSAYLWCGDSLIWASTIDTFHITGGLHTITKTPVNTTIISNKTYIWGAYLHVIDGNHYPNAFALKEVTLAY